MATPQIRPRTEWRSEWFEFEDVAYLDAAGQAALPRVAIRAVQATLEWKKFPHKLPAEAHFGLPSRVRTKLAALVGAQPEAIALTTGASAGMAAVANGFAWRPEDEVLMARGEFPAHLATWLPLDETGRLRVRIVAPRGRFITADDFIEALSPRTRLVSVSLVRFDDAARCDAERLAAAVQQNGAMLLIDAAQCAGALPLNLTTLGADFVVASGYKWLLGPYGTGFFWARRERLEELRGAPAYWTAFEGAEQFDRLNSGSMKLRAGAARWDAPETSSFFNLAAWDAALGLLLEAGVETVWRHNGQLIEQIIRRLPLDRCVLASPAQAEQRGPFVCVQARQPERTAQLHQKLRDAGVFVSLREGALRIAPHLYNTERDVDRLIRVLTI